MEPQEEKDKKKASCKVRTYAVPTQNYSKDTFYASLSCLTQNHFFGPGPRSLAKVILHAGRNTHSLCLRASSRLVLMGDCTARAVSLHLSNSLASRRDAFMSHVLCVPKGDHQAPGQLTEGRPLPQNFGVRLGHPTVP